MNGQDSGSNAGQVLPVKTPSCREVEAACRNITRYLHRTPVVTSRTVNRLVGAELFFKCENLQKTGAFKARGALNAVLRCEGEHSNFITHSSGNHGAALAWAAGIAGSTATVIVPKDALPEKLESMRRYGARLKLCGSTLQDREGVLEQTRCEGEFKEIPPYDHFDIVAGQGTCAWELLGQVENLNQLWMPVGGGGLAAGSAIAGDGRVEIVCAEPELARDAHDSLRSGSRLPPYPPRTMADGLRTGLGEVNFQTLRHFGASVALATEQGISDATLLLWSCLNMIVEPSSAVVLAAMLENPGRAAGRVGVILSGGNVLPQFGAG
ncbi:MAG: pyridoxal-phosphate dependent enzyme [Pseudomonadales bacterium]|nr:pyridoxal-phosphate dependent enzyme [Pseudomonadales bacterium]